MYLYYTMNLDMITFIKLLGIIYICIIDIIVGLVISGLVDKYIFKKFFYKKKKVDDSTNNTRYYIFKFLKIGLMIGILVSCSYIFRHIIQYIPFPLDNYHGFKYYKLNEFRSNSLLTTILILYNNTLQYNIKDSKKDLKYDD